MNQAGLYRFDRSERQADLLVLNTIVRADYLADSP